MIYYTPVSDVLAEALKAYYHRVQSDIREKRVQMPSGLIWLFSSSSIPQKTRRLEFHPVTFV